MNEWGKYLFKLAVMRDLFEIKQIGARLRERSDFTYSNAALGQYLKKPGDKNFRNPPPDFFDFVREALELSEEEYQTLLFLHHQSKPTPTPMQQKQMQHFREVLLLRIVQGLRGDNGLGGVGAAG